MPRDIWRHIPIDSQQGRNAKCYMLETVIFAELLVLHTPITAQLIQCSDIKIKYQSPVAVKTQTNHAEHSEINKRTVSVKLSTIIDLS